MDNDTAWKHNAEYWQTIIREDRDRYRTECLTPALLEQIGECRDQTVLDAGCGEGHVSRHCARRGATVTAIDSCPLLVTATKQASKAAGLPMRVLQADIRALPFPPSSFDIALAVLVLNELEHPARAIAELARVTKPGGRVILILLHPCFYRANRKRDDVLEPISAAQYFDVRRLQQTFLVNGEASPAPVTLWLRPLEEWAAACSSAGLLITNLREPRPSVLADPWWEKNFRVPLFLSIEASPAPR